MGAEECGLQNEAPAEMDAIEIDAIEIDTIEIDTIENDAVEIVPASVDHSRSKKRQCTHGAFARLASAKAHTGTATVR